MEQRVFVRAEPQQRARCTLAHAAASIRRLLETDDGYIPADDASTLEFAADALEELANGVQPASSSEPGASLPSSDGAAANGVHAGATSEQDSDEDAGEEEEQEQAPAKKEKRKKKRKAAEAAEALEVGADEGAQQNGTGNTKKKRRKDKQG